MTDEISAEKLNELRESLLKDRDQISKRLGAIEEYINAKEKVRVMIQDGFSKDAGISKHGNQKQNLGPLFDPPKLNNRSGLTGHIKTAIQSQNGEFTIRSIILWLKENHPNFKFKNPSVSAILSGLAKVKFVHKTFKGNGLEPTKYKRGH